MSSALFGRAGVIPTSAGSSNYLLLQLIKRMKITFDASKREKNRAEKGLDFERAAEVFEGVTVTRSDERKAYGEPRFVTSVRLDGRIVVVVWTPRGPARRIISMRKANEREIKKYTAALG